jgi:hypothetical protein
VKIRNEKTGALIETTPFTIRGQKYFEEAIIPSELFQDFAMVGTEDPGAIAFLGCPLGAWKDPDMGDCRAYPGGPPALALASIYHPMGNLMEVLGAFEANRRDKVHRRAWRRFNRIQDSIFKYHGMQRPS